jgi:EAL domain-containing protein (putative c-di-GMP-specific phosphodiesterase class I)
VTRTSHRCCRESPVYWVAIVYQFFCSIRIQSSMRRACAQFARWRSEGLRLEYMSVNVSMRQLRDENYMATLNAALADSGMQGNDLQIEITESVLAHGAELQKTLVNIAALGVRLALDDFGTGYSSLSYLRNYPIQTVKIDRSFVLGLPHDPGACRLAESIIVMCAALGKNVIAEGVETEQQREFLRRAGCGPYSATCSAVPWKRLTSRDLRADCVR